MKAGFPEGVDVHALVHEAFPAGIDDGRGAATVGIARGKGGEGLAEVGMEGGCGFDFDGVEVPFALFDEIDFDPVGIAVEMEVGLEAVVEGSFHRFENDEVFEQAAAEGIAVELFRGFDAREGAGEAGVVEVDFGGFDDALGDVGEPGLQTA